MARDIAATIDTTGRIRPEDFVRGVINSPNDQDWYRVRLDPGAYVFTLSGTGDHPVGRPQLVLRDADGRAIEHNDEDYRGSGESRIEFEVTDAAQTVYLDVGGNGGHGPGRAAGDYALGINQLDGSPLDAIAGSQALEARVIDVYFVPKGETARLPSGTVKSTGWNGYQTDQAMAALSAFSEVCDVRFRRTHERSEADFQVLLNGHKEGRVLGRFGPPGTEAEGIGYFASHPGKPFAAPWGTQPHGALEPGAFGWGLMLHEFGHGLGLAHPHDDGFGSVVMEGVRGPNNPGGLGLNDPLYTVMTYRQHDDPGHYWFANAMGPMAFDIAVLQQKYGSVRSHAGQDSYRLQDSNGEGTGYLCLWDTGGEDTIRAGRIDRDCTINLNAATLAYEPGGGGFLSSAQGVHGGFTIANGVMIENAIGGNGDDRLVGNAAENRLSGGSGADRIEGGGAGDRLEAGDDNARDVFVYRSVSDSRVAHAAADRITGFDARGSRHEETWDRIDLTRLDGDEDARGNQSLRFVRDFHDSDAGEQAGQVRVERRGGAAHALVDLDGDNEADMRIIVADTDRLRADDFLL